MARPGPMVLDEVQRIPDLLLAVSRPARPPSFRALNRLPTPEQLQPFARMAADNGWTTRQLRQAIDAGGDLVTLDDLTPPAGSTLRPRFGLPFTYRVLADRLLDAAPPAIDFGFHQVWVPDDQLAGFGISRGRAR